MSPKAKQQPNEGGATRVATIARKTKETEIKLRIDLDGSCQYSIETGIPFFDHMLDEEDDCVRINLGTPEENDRLLAELDDIAGRG